MSANTNRGQDAQTRQALVEGFINMSNMEPLKDESGQVFSQSRRGGGAGEDVYDGQPYHPGKDYVDMDDDVYDETAGLDGGDGDNTGAIKENSSILTSAFNIFKANVGSAIFMLPVFYQDAGYVLSPIINILIGMGVTDCTHMLLGVRIAINRRDVTTYSQVVRWVLGRAAGWVLFVCLCVTQYGFCLMFSQLASASFQELADFNGSHYVCVSLVLIIGFSMSCFSDNLTIISVASLIASVGVAYTIICCFIQICMTLGSDGVSDTISPVGHNIPMGWFNCMANIMMSLEGIAAVLPVYSSCTQKRLMGRMVTMVLGGVITMLALFGICGYLAFGTEMSTSVVGSMPYNAWGTSIRAMFLINLMLSYPVQFMSAQQLVDFVIGCRCRSWKGILARAIINLVVWALAMALPADAVTIVVGFIGALPCCFMAMIFPSLLAAQTPYALAHPDEDRSSGHYWKMLVTGAGHCFTWTRVRCVIYLVVAVVVMVMGTIGIIQTHFLS